MGSRGSVMSELLLRSDVAIGAAGGSALERCVMGLPSIIVVTAENQRLGAVALQRRGAAMLIASPSLVPEVLPSMLSLLRNVDALGSLSSAAAAVADGQGLGRLLLAMERTG